MKPGVKKAIKIPCIILGVILVLLIIVNFIAGPIAKSYINNHCKELCGRTVTVEKIRTNLFVGKVKIMGLTMMELNDKDEFCSFDTLIVKINPFKLISNEVKLNEITLINPKAVIIQDGDAFNFDSLIDFYASDEEEPEEEDSTNWIINLNDITLKGGEVDYRDVAIGSQFDMGNL
ncbi:MAG: AsmA family protein, partial [Bacteroidales bacterium]|nr:AsmA family protein [Bacteroidales bacterium]